MRIRTALTLCGVSLLLLVLPAAGSATSIYGSISGTIYLDGQPGANLCATAYDGDTAVTFANTDAGGGYQLTSLPPAQYTVKFDDCGPGYTTTEWFSHAPTMQDAIALDVNPGEDTGGINGALDSAGRVFGHVTAAGGAPLHGVCVHAANMTTAQVADTTTDVNGNYALTGVVPGQTQIRFRGCTAGNYVIQSTEITVAGGQTNYGVDAVMTAAGRISGHVQNADGIPLQGFCVYGNANGSPIPSAVTDAGGNYTIGEVPASGTYDLTAQDCWNHAYLSLEKTGALVAAPTTTYVDFTLEPAATIMGRVTDADGNGIPSACISAKNQATGVSTPGESRLDGNYDIAGLTPGTYDVTFDPCNAASFLVPVMDHDVVVPPTGTANADATLLAGGKVAGHVATPDGQLAGVCVHAGSAEARTGADGSYTLGPVPAGTYAVTFTAKGCAEGDWDSATAAGVSVTAGKTTAGVDATLHTAAPAPETSTVPPAAVPSGGTPSSDPPGGAQPQLQPEPTVHPTTTPGCKVPKLVGLSLAKARKALARAGCGLGKVSKKRAHRRTRKGKVLRQRTGRGAAKPAGFKVAVTVAR
jgi:hypothetical protein